MEILWHFNELLWINPLKLNRYWIKRDKISPHFIEKQDTDQSAVIFPRQISKFALLYSRFRFA